MRLPLIARDFWPKFGVNKIWEAFEDPFMRLSLTSQMAKVFSLGYLRDEGLSEGPLIRLSLASWSLKIINPSSKWMRFKSLQRSSYKITPHFSMTKIFNSAQLRDVRLLKGPIIGLLLTSYHPRSSTRIIVDNNWSIIYPQGMLIKET